MWWAHTVLYLNVMLTNDASDGNLDSTKTVINKHPAVINTKHPKHIQTKSSNGSRKTLSVYDNFGERKMKAEPVDDGIAIYCMTDTRSAVKNNEVAPRSASLRTSWPIIPLQDPLASRYPQDETIEYVTLAFKYEMRWLVKMKQTFVIVSICLSR